MKINFLNTVVKCMVNIRVQHYCSEYLDVICAHLVLLENNPVKYTKGLTVPDFRQIVNGAIQANITNIVIYDSPLKIAKIIRCTLKQYYGL